MSLPVYPQRAVAAPLVESPHVELDVGLTIAVLRRRDRAGGAKCKHNRQESRALHARWKRKRRAAENREEYSPVVQNFPMASRLLSSLTCHE
jgi:hypothetical protein